jgi:hypothetical protein
MNSTVAGHRLASFLVVTLAACGGASQSDAGDATNGTDASDTAAPHDVVATDAPVDVPPMPDPNPALAGDLDLTDLAFFQGTRVALFTSGAAVAARNAPIVADRAAVVRAYVTPHSGFVARDLTARLVVSRPGVADVAIDDMRRIAGASTEADASSVFAFDVPAELVTDAARYAVSVLDANGTHVAPGTAANARLPRDGSNALLGAQSDAGGVELVLVPLRYDTDGSGRLPDTSATQLDRIRSLLTALYPIRTANITVHTPVPWNNSLTFRGNVDFGAVNQMLIDLRTSDGAIDRQYYYALVAPASNFSTYCGGSCVTGQSYVVTDPSAADSRVGSGVGWGTESSAWTLAHELGHEHGRSHAPCDAGGADPDFPYAGGSIGVWGYDSRSRTFIALDMADDFMGYCDPTWTSDYTWSAIFERVRAVNGAGAR